MDEFTTTDWIIVSIVLVIGLVASAIKVFLFDDQDY